MRFVLGYSSTMVPIPSLTFVKGVLSSLLLEMKTSQRIRSITRLSFFTTQIKPL